MSSTVVKYEEWWDYFGTVVPKSNISYSPSLPYDRGKVADLSGSFIPGQYKTTSMSAFTESLSVTDVTLTYDWVRNPNWVQHYRISGPINSEACSLIPQAPGFRNLTADIYNSALLQACAKLGQGDLDLGVEFGELKETIQMLRSPLASLRRALLNKRTLSMLPAMLKHEGGRRTLSRRSLKAMPDTWLEIRYGVMPLIRSIMDILRVLQDRLTKLDVEHIYVSKGKSSINKTSSGTTPVFGFAPCTWTADYNIEYQLNVIAFVHYKFNEVPTVADLLGLSVESIPSIIWDLTSLTFVLGWFFSLGNYISAYTPKPNINVLGACVGCKIDGTGYVASKQYTTWPIFEGENPKDEYEWTSYERLAAVEKPLLPGLRPDIDLGWSQIVDLILLIGQRLPKGVRDVIT